MVSAGVTLSNKKNRNKLHKSHLKNIILIALCFIAFLFRVKKSKTIQNP